jgi:hypothetical protein
MSAAVLAPDMTRKTVTGTSNATAPRSARFCFSKITKCGLFSISVSGVSHAIVFADVPIRRVAGAGNADVEAVSVEIVFWAKLESCGLIESAAFVLRVGGV